MTTTSPDRDADGRDHLVRLPDGRTLALTDRGPSDGPAVLFLPSAPGSRLLDPEPAATTAAGIRLLTVDRPGYGRSDPFPPDVVPTVPAGADLVAAALAALGIAEVAAVGWSAGGRVAAALAARHPRLVRALALVGTPAPDDEVRWVPDEFRSVLAAMRTEPSTAMAQLAPALAPLAETAAAGLASIAAGPADDTVLADPDRRGRVEHMLAEAFRQQTAGAAADIVADQVVPWGFEPAAIGAQTVLFYGTHDVIVPPPHGQWWAGRIPGAQLRPVPEGGHLLVLTRWVEILAAVSAA